MMISRISGYTTLRSSQNFGKVEQLATKSDIDDLRRCYSLDEYKAQLANIKNSNKKLSIQKSQELRRLIKNYVDCLKFPGSYRNATADTRLFMLLTHIRSVQPNDFNDVLKYLIDCIKDIGY